MEIYYGNAHGELRIFKDHFSAIDWVSSCCPGATRVDGLRVGFLDSTGRIGECGVINFDAADYRRGGCYLELISALHSCAVITQEYAESGEVMTA